MPTKRHPWDLPWQPRHASAELLAFVAGVMTEHRVSMGQNTGERGDGSWWLTWWPAWRYRPVWWEKTEPAGWQMVRVGAWEAVSACRWEQIYPMDRDLEFKDGCTYKRAVKQLTTLVTCDHCRVLVDAVLEARR